MKFRIFLFLKLRLVLSLSFQYVLYRHAYLLRGTPEVSRALSIWDNISGSIIMFLDSSVLPTSTLKSLQLYPWATQFSFWSIYHSYSLLRFSLQRHCTQSSHFTILFMVSWSRLKTACLGLCGMLLLNVFSQVKWLLRQHREISFSDQKKPFFSQSVG